MAVSAICSAFNILSILPKKSNQIFRKGFLDTGVERIVDQVVNPKLNSNFVPKIEDVAYKYLGLEKPKNHVRKLNLPLDQQALLPTMDLEQVSPDSEKCPSFGSRSPNTDHKFLIDAQHDESNDKLDDLESPAFEPIEPFHTKVIKDEKDDTDDDDKMDICSDDTNEPPPQMNGGVTMAIHADEVKSNLSSISGLTSNESISESLAKEMEDLKSDEPEVKTEMDTSDLHTEEMANIINEEKSQQPPLPISEEKHSEPDSVLNVAIAEKSVQSNNTINYVNDANLENIKEDSVLSQVSSNSRLSIVTNNNTNSRMDEAEVDVNNIDILSAGNCDADTKPNLHDTCPYGISEEAQMQKFNDSSSSSNSLVVDTENVSNGTNNFDKQTGFVTNFDIKKEEIKFEGTERKSFDIQASEQTDMDAAKYETAKEFAADDGIKTETNSSAEINNITNDSKEIGEMNWSSSESIRIDTSKSDSLKCESASNDGTRVSETEARVAKQHEDSNSSNSKYRERSDNKSSSTNRNNGNDSENKHRSKDRHSTLR